VLAKKSLMNILSVFGKEAFQIKEVLNTFYSQVIDCRKSSANSCLDLIEVLLAFGRNHLQADYYFAFLVSTHSLCINRFQFATAQMVEEYLQDMLSLYAVHDHLKVA
jgi:hypothetical protein